MKTVLAMLVLCLGSSAFAETVCSPDDVRNAGTFNDALLERWYSWCSSVGGRWGADARCYCDEGVSQSGGSDSYDYEAARRAAEEQARREEEERRREAQLQKEALEHAERVARQLQELDQRGAAIGVQAGQLQTSLRQIKDRETKTAPVSKDLAPVVVVPALRPSTVPLSASRYLNKGSGRPVGDCEAEAQVVDRLKAGLPTQEAAIAKTQAQLAAARSSAREHRQALREQAVKQAVERVTAVARKYLATVERAHQLAGWGDISRGRAADPARLRNRDIAELMGQFEELRGELEEMKADWEKAQSAAVAGAEMGKALAERSHSLAQKMALLNRKLGESGLWSRAGGALASSFGPAGEAAFEMAELSIEVAVELGGVVLSDQEVARAEESLQIMRSQHQRASGMILEKELRLRELRASNACLEGGRN